MNVFELYAKLKLDDADYKKGLKGSLGEASKFANSLDKGLNKVLKIGAAAAGAAVAGMTAFAKASVQTGMQFDTAMSQVAATMGTTVDQIQELRDFAQEMGAKTAFSATQAAEALNYMALAGYDAETSMQMLPNVLNLAAAGNIDLARASDMVTDAQTALGLTTEQTTTMVDQMAATASKSNTSVAQLGDAMLTIGATARNLKGGTQELSTVLGVLADNGIKGAEGGTHLRNAILSLQTPTKDGTEALEQLGMTYEDMYDEAGNLRALPEIFQQMSDAMEGMNQQSKDAIISGIFNKTDLASINALLGTSKDRWTELSAAIGDSAGAAEKMADTQLDNLNGDITLMKSALEGVKIQFSDGITPAIRDTVQTITRALSKGTTQRYLNEVGKKIGEVVQALTGKVMNAIPRILTLFDNGGAKIKAFGAAFAGLALAIKATVNPVGALATAFGLLIGKIALDALTADDARKKHSVLTDEMRDNIDACVDAADAYDQLKESRDDQLYQIDQESKQTQALWEELQSLADANGAVIDGNEDRAKQIAGELSTATGVEIELVDGVIQKYNELSGAIDNAIAKHRAEAMIAANEETYKQALTNLPKVQDAIGDLSTEIAGYEEKLTDVNDRWGELNSIGYDNMSGAQKSEWVSLGNQMGELKSAISGASTELTTLQAQEEEYWHDIEMQESAYKSAAEGNFKAVSDAYANDSFNRRQHMIEMGKITQEEIDMLKRDADNAAAAAERYEQRMKATGEGNQQRLDELNAKAEQLAGQYKAATEQVTELGEVDPEVEIESNAKDEAESVATVNSELDRLSGRSIQYWVKENVTREVEEKQVDSSNAIGLDYVPFNNYSAMLHRGEAVLTAREAEDWRRGEQAGASTELVSSILEVLQDIAANGLNANVSTRSLYRSMRQENKTRTTATNYNAFAMA